MDLSVINIPEDINNQNKGNAAIDEMFLQSQVWDTKTGQVVWEGMGGVAASKSYPINVVEHTTANLAKVLAQNKEKIYLILLFC